MADKYKVLDIEEMDFGCEGLPEGEEYCAEVTLKNETNNSTIKIKYADAELYRQNINSGDSVYFENGKLAKIK
ncbi:MAG: hypothetical protein ACI4M3_03375 [Acutalibacteraceae bacterium]